MLLVSGVVNITFKSACLCNLQAADRNASSSLEENGGVGIRDGRSFRLHPVHGHKGSDSCDWQGSGLLIAKIVWYTDQSMVREDSKFCKDTVQR